MYSTKIIYFIIFFFNVNAEDEYCAIDNKEKCSEINHINNNFIDGNNEFKNYYELINNAEDNYEECNSKGCECYQNVIANDLKTFSIKGIDLKLIENSISKGTIYQIINGKVYRNKECMFPSRCAGVEHFLLKIAKNVSDTEFIINTRDYPQSSKYFGEPLPIFSFSKTKDYYDIMYPAWSFWEGGPAIKLYPKGLGRWDKHRISINNASQNIPWDKKEKKVFFRGSRTSSERDNLILLSRRMPTLADAQFTKNQAWKSNKDTLDQSPVAEVSLEYHCKYKYLFNFRGVAASFRHKHLFLCNSLVLHVGDEWLEFYYDAMKPWIHYIPISKDADQYKLQRLIEFVMNNNEISKKIAQRGRNFIWEKLKMSDVTCYWKTLLKKYTKLLTYKPILRNNLINIKDR